MKKLFIITLLLLIGSPANAGENEIDFLFKHGKAPIYKSNNCPDSFSVKGNIDTDSKVVAYYVLGQKGYKRVTAERCYKNVEDAKLDGFGTVDEKILVEVFFNYGKLPKSKNSCPKSHPLKGNINTNKDKRTLIYHQLGDRWFYKTDPERCYKDGGEAAKDGFRASKV